MTRIAASQSRVHRGLLYTFTQRHTVLKYTTCRGVLITNAITEHKILTYMKLISCTLKLISCTLNFTFLKLLLLFKNFGAKMTYFL